jgi:hypothetical protein
MGSTLKKLSGMKFGWKTRTFLILFVLTLAGLLWYLWYNVQQYDALPYRGRLIQSSHGISLYDMPGDAQPQRHLDGSSWVALAGDYEEFYYVRTRRGTTGWIKKVDVKKIINQHELDEARRNMMKAIEQGKSGFNPMKGG